MNSNLVMAEAPPPCYNCNPEWTQQQSRSKLIGTNALRCARFRGCSVAAQGNGDSPRPQQTTCTEQSYNLENLYYLRDSGTPGGVGKTHADPPLPLRAASPVFSHSSSASWHALHQIYVCWTEFSVTDVKVQYQKFPQSLPFVFEFSGL